MSDWLLNATRLFRGHSEEQAAVFELGCGCGQTLSGVRMAIPQVVECPECRESRFILPGSPYPEPKPARTRGLQGWMNGRGPASNDRPASRSSGGPEPADPAGVELIDGSTVGGADEVAATTPQGAPRPRKMLERESRAADHRSQRPGKSLSSHTPPPLSPEAQPKPARRRPAVSIEGVRLKPEHKSFRLVTPVRLVLALTVAVAVAGGWWLNRERERSHAEKTLAESGRRLVDSLDKGELQAAAEHSDRVLAAISVLGRDEPRALAIRQTARETVAAARLSKASLGELLVEAANARLTASSSWDEYFRSQYRGGWIVFDAMVSLEPAEKGRLNYIIDCPLAFDAISARVTGAIPEFNRLPLSVDEPRRVIFSAQLHAIFQDTGQDSGWVIELIPHTAFLWSTANSLAALGFPLDEETKAILRQQSDLLGISP